MSDFDEFLKAAKGEVSAAQFERDVAAGLVSDIEFGSRLRLVGNPARPLAVSNGFKTYEAWRAYCELMPKSPPVFREFKRAAEGWIEIE
jgi:hypothetical protein